MEIKDIRQFSEIGGVRKNPTVTQHGKFTKWNNNSGKFDYNCVGDGGDSDINVDYWTAFVTNIFEDISTDDYLTYVGKLGGLVHPNWAEFQMHTSGTKYLPLGALAWLDEVPSDKTGIVLPGDKKILFDNNDSIGGSSNFKYDYNTNRVLATGTKYFIDAKEVVAHSGTNSFYFGFGGISPTSGGTRNINTGWYAGRYLTTGSEDNTNIGPYAGSTPYSTMKRAINIGAHSGKYANTDDEFYLDNADYGDTATAKAKSFLYADLATERRLYIRDRLSVGKEGKFGDSGLADGAGEAGMFQMLPVSAGVVKPQWYSNGIWNDFESSVDVYLSNVTYGSGGLTFTMSDATTIGPVDISAVNTTTFATSPNSPATGQTATSDYGYLQISNSSFDNDEGFTFKDGLRWDNGNTELNIPGAIKMASKALYSASNGVFLQDGSHAYVRLGGAWKQLDNDPVVGENIVGENIGGADYEVYNTRVDDTLEFRTFQEMEYDEILNPYHRITMKYSSDGAAILIGTTAELNYLSTTVNTVDDRFLERTKGNGEALPIRAIRQGSGMVITQTEEYIQFDAVNGGAAALMTGSNLGAYDIFKQVNGVDFEFYGIDTIDTRVVLTQGATDVEIELDLDFVSADAAVVGVGEASLKSTITGTGVTGDEYTFTYKKLTSPLSSVVITETATEIQVEATSVAATGTNLPDPVTTSIPIYITGSAPDFEFKTLNTVDLNGHLNITANPDGETIDFEVDDLTYTYKGTIATAKELLEGTSGFEIVSKGIAVNADCGLTLDESTDNDIIIDQAIPIPYFDTGGGTAFMTTNLSSTSSKIVQEVYYKADARTGEAGAVATKYFELKLSGGLTYDINTNTLGTNISGGGGDTDYHLVDVNYSDEETTLDIIFDVKDSEGNHAGESPITLSIPRTAIISNLPVATYVDNTDPHVGTIEVDKSIYNWEDGQTQQLELDELTGVLKSPVAFVSYEQQNILHDEDNLSDPSFNTKRAQARANIGAAYVEGSAGENFNAKDLTAAGILEAAATDVVHVIGSIDIQDNEISSSTGTVRISGLSEQSIEQGFAETKITLDADASGVFTIYNSAGTKLFHLDVVGNMYLAGNIYAAGDIESRDTNTLPTVGILPLS